MSGKNKILTLNNEMVFVNAYDTEWGPIWEKKELKNADPEKIIKCKICDKPSSILDNLYPYHSEMNRCEKHKNRSVNTTHVAIMGGAFDPPTIGHINLAEFVMESCPFLDGLWIMPCFSHPYDKKMAPPKHRIKMCQLASQDNDKIKVSNYEIINGMDGTTYKIIQKLRNEFIDFNYRIVIGSDNAITFSKWKNYKKLAQSIPFIIVPRKGTVTKIPSLLSTNPHICLSSEHAIPEISSTKIREYLLKNVMDLAKDFMNADVLQYIQENKLYDNRAK